MVKGAAIELVPRGVTVNNVQPGPTTTDMTKKHTERVLPVISLGRMGKTREVAGLVTYLESEDRRRQRDDRRRLFCLGPKS